MVEPRGAELIRRYRENYGIAIDAYLTEEMILRHWSLERQLTQELLNSSPSNRAEIFEYAYTTLYKELDWLNRLIDSERKVNLDEDYKIWIDRIGPPPQKIYEIGSGRGELISYLSSKGYHCTATEITRERGEKWTDNLSGLAWSISDGVNLSRFEQDNFYDLIISDQVIEHLHPGDLSSHLQGVFTILRGGGRYIFSTPHAYSGPWDISRVFGCQKPRGMHLKEYTYSELLKKLRRAGFRRIHTEIHPQRLKHQSSMLESHIQILFLSYLVLIENIIKLLPRQKIRRSAVSWAAEKLNFKSNILLIAYKD